MMKRHLLVLSLLLMAAAASADTVYLSSGETVKGLVVEEHYDRLVVSTYKGEVEIPRPSVDQVFFDTEEQNYAYLGDEAVNGGDFQLAWGFYQKAYQINPESAKIDGALARLVDAVNREKLNVRPEDLPRRLKEQLGIVIEKIGNKIRVRSVDENSPAKTAGIAAGDFIVEVWNASIAYMDIGKAAEMMAGLEGTPIRLSIERHVGLPAGAVGWFKRAFRLAQYRDFGFDLSLRPPGLTATYVNPLSVSGQGGLRALDIITHINAEPTRYMSMPSVKQKIFQNYLKKIVLTARRNVTLTRGGK